MLSLFMTIQHENDQNNQSNQNKLEALYEKYRLDMFKVAYRVLKDYHLAQDAVQSAFIKLLNNLDNIEQIDSRKTRAFVIIVTRNISINFYRKRQRQNNVVLEDIENILADESQFIDDKIINAELLDKITLKIKNLYEPYADILTLRYLYHYSDKEIAELLGISHENVRTRLHRAKRSLIKEIMKDEGWDKNGFISKRKSKTKDT